MGDVRLFTSDKDAVKLNKRFIIPIIVILVVIIVADNFFDTSRDQMNLLFIGFAVVVIGITLYAIYHRIMKKDYIHKYYSPKDIVFNAAEVNNESILLKIAENKGKKLERISFNNIKKVRIRSVRKDMIIGRDTVRVFEFIHIHGENPLLLHDINDREAFEEIIREKGIEITTD